MIRYSVIDRIVTCIFGMFNSENSAEVRKAQRDEAETLFRTLDHAEKEEFYRIYTQKVNEYDRSGRR